MELLLNVVVVCDYKDWLFMYCCLIEVFDWFLVWIEVGLLIIDINVENFV